LKAFAYHHWYAYHSLGTTALAFTVINYIRELIAQKLDDNGIHCIMGFILYVNSIGIRADDAYFVGEIHTL